MEHSKHLFNLKYFWSTFVELCLKKNNRDTEFRDIQSAPVKGEKRCNIPPTQFYLKFSAEHVRHPCCTDRDRQLRPLALHPLFLWLISLQGYRKKRERPLTKACRVYRWLKWGRTKKLRQNISPTLLTFSGNRMPDYQKKKQTKHSTLTTNQRTAIMVQS